MNRYFRKISLAMGAGFVAVLVAAAPASAATVASWAAWSPLAGVGGAYTSSVIVAPQPNLSATIASDSRAGQVGVISGASVWLAQGTPVGAKYGSSASQPYVNLRPKADSAVAPSTTSYSFATPTPPSGWTFVLGDIDADKVQIRAIGPDGVALTASQLGYQSSFNYCAAGVVGKPSCTGDAAEVPIWDAASLTLTGNAGAVDTSGAAAWFEPSAPISTLSFVFTRRSGFPVYQTWFASLARDITGTVSDQSSGPVDGVVVRLIDRDGQLVDTTTTGGGGLYEFVGYLATDGYTIEVEAPAGKIVVGTARGPADLTTSDAAVDFTVRELVPVPVSGSVRDDDGNPVAGATVTLPGVGTTTTDSNGDYVFDSVPVGSYTPTVAPPPGYTVTTAPPQFTVPPGVEAPITGQDFVLTPNPSLSGFVTASGAGIAGVTVTAVGPDGSVSTVTGADGSYAFPLLPTGDYTVSVAPPTGYLVIGASSLERAVADADVTDVDFALAHVGSLGGLVTTTDGAPLGGVTVTVDGPNGPVRLVADADGSYATGDLPPGTYTVTLTVPDGYTAIGPVTQQLVVDGSGAALTAEPFVLEPDSIEPTPEPSPSPDPGVAVSSGPSGLPATGVDSSLFGAAGVAALAALAGAVLLGTRCALALMRRRG